MLMQRSLFIFAVLAFGILVIPALAARAQSATGTLTVDLTNASALIMVFNSDVAGLTLGNPGTSAATLGFGTVANYKTPAIGVTQTSSSSSFTVSSPFDVYVELGGATSANYNLTAAIAAKAPTGLSVKMDSTTLTTKAQTVSTTGIYFSNVAHTVSLVVSTAPSGSGGPATGTQLNATINLTATAN